MAAKRASWGYASLRLGAGAVALVTLALVELAPVDARNRLQRGAARAIYAFDPTYPTIAPRQRPATIRLNNREQLYGLRWRDWGRAVAQASGLRSVATTPRPFRVTVTASAVRRCTVRVKRGGSYRGVTLWFYNEIRFRYVRERPPNLPATETVRRPCASP